MSPDLPLGSSPAQHNNLAQFGQRQIDPCNLFIKDLGPKVMSGDLFQAFRQFGTIVLAWVMKNVATGKSKQFGFVSFTTDEATTGLLFDCKRSRNSRKAKLELSILSHNQLLLNTLSIESPELSCLGSVEGKTEPIAESLGSLQINNSQAAALVTPIKGSITSRLSLPSGKIQAYNSSPGLNVCRHDGKHSLHLEQE
ncbi:hypothetical protein BY996DRAFT_6613513 [Phakopsora pachyrhizi]|nr:hypothetical protein BY996DRAFT_6613513 [Phakopsora pachyrhizi]